MVLLILWMWRRRRGRGLGRLVVEFVVAERLFEQGRRWRGGGGVVGGSGSGARLGCGCWIYVLDV